MKSVKNLNRILWAKKFWFKALKCQIWLGNKKPFIWESEANSKTLQDSSSYISVSYKVVVKSLKNQNRILWVTEYWFKALKCQISLTNTKPFFWENEVSIVTFSEVSSYIWVLYKFVLNGVKRLNRILWATQYWLKVLKCKI